jgi:hypothetical protein
VIVIFSITISEPKKRKVLSISEKLDIQAQAKLVRKKVVTLASRLGTSPSALNSSKIGKTLNVLCTM